MTTLATTLGALPIALAIGSAGTSRVPLGIVIVGGMLFALILTLYVVPALYSYLSSTKRVSAFEAAVAEPAEISVMHKTRKIFHMPKHMFIQKYIQQTDGLFSKWIVMLVFSSCISFGARAQQLLTLQDAIAIALQNNYDIQLAESDSARLGLDYTYRNVVFLPRLNAAVGTNWTNYDQRQEFSDGTERKGNVATNNLSASVTLNWTLFDGMKMFVLKIKLKSMSNSVNSV